MPAPSGWLEWVTGAATTVITDPGLFFNAVVAGLLLGGFYTAVALGLSIAFGQLDIVNIAHPAFIIIGSYFAYLFGALYGFDPVLTGIILTPVFFVLGIVVYRIYYASFERTGQESLSGLAFFFGLMFIIEVTLIMIYGVDYRLVAGALYRRQLEDRHRRHPAAHGHSRSPSPC